MEDYRGKPDAAQGRSAQDCHHHRRPTSTLRRIPRQANRLRTWVYDSDGFEAKTEYPRHHHCRHERVEADDMEATACEAQNYNVMPSFGW